MEIDLKMNETKFFTTLIIFQMFQTMTVVTIYFFI